jgi:uncharacterized protein (DUF2267 family)
MHHLDPTMILPTSPSMNLSAAKQRPILLEGMMSTTGLDVFDKTFQATNIWLDEIMEVVGPDRGVAWHVLGAVLSTLRDRLPLRLAAHLGAQLPLLVRGTYYDQFQPGHDMERVSTEDEFLARVAREFGGIRPVNVRLATRSVLSVLGRHVSPGLADKVRDALPGHIRTLWTETEEIA